MVNKKLWAHYERVKSILNIYITLFFLVPFISLCFSYLAHSTDIDSGVQDAVKTALLSGLKWSAIIIAVMTAVFIIWFVFYSDRVEFTDIEIKYYRWLFSKKFRTIPYEQITECVVMANIWNDKRDPTRRRKIILFNKKNIIITFDIYGKLALLLVIKLGENKFRLVGDSYNVTTISRYYRIDFMSLNFDEQLKILNYYCKLTSNKYKTGKEILYKK